MALRFKRTTPLEWPKEVVLEHELVKKRRYERGTTMFPTTHDITPGNLQACEMVLKNLLGAGNKVLIVSKPHRVCVQALIQSLAEWKGQILFRFTIGVIDEDLRKLWEPGAPDFAERLDSLRLAYEAGYETSVSIEPLLEPWNVHSLIRNLRPLVTHSIWIGKANQLRQRTSWKLPADHPELVRLLSWQTDDRIREIYENLHDDPLVKWKDSYKEVIGIDRPQKAGLDV
jgi:DNA repair photolyase